MARMLIALLGLVLGAEAFAAELPAHDPLRILIVSDEVNPHGLPDSALTQPGELSVALSAMDSGLEIDPAPMSLREIPTDSLGEATAALSVPFGDPAAYDVLVYFAHRIPNGGGGAALQAAFETAVDSFLVQGGGLVSFHHGVYVTAGKEGMADILGVAATGAVPWNTVDGQNVINTAPGHFVTEFGVEYPDSVAYSDVARGVPADTYRFFNNTPDERYSTMEIDPQAGSVQVILGSDYDQNGTSHILAWIHDRPGWAGRVIGYQPGEYQPNALDDRDGNNFQLLVNMIYWASGAPTVSTPEEPRPARPVLRAYPNPFRNAVTIELPDGEGPLAVDIFDLRGRRVRGWSGATAGAHVWDGRDRAGQPLPTGVYFYRVRSARSVHSGMLHRIP